MKTKEFRLNQKYNESKKLFNELKESIDIREVFKFLIEETTSYKIEHGLNICKKDKNFMTSTNACSGDTCSVEPGRSKCPEGTLTIGDFHTHPSGDRHASMDDAYRANYLGHKIFCIGAKNENEYFVDCYAPITDKETWWVGGISVSKDKSRSIIIEKEKEPHFITPGEWKEFSKRLK